MPGRQRLASLDALRGLAVVGMLLVNNAGVPGAMPAQLRHSHGGGLTAADVVFPLFLFVAGIGMSRSSRLGRLPAVLRRSALLFALGCLLVSAKYHHLSPSTGVLQHIAIATLGAYAILRLPRRIQPWAWGGGLALAWALPTFVALPGTVAGSWAPDSTLSAAVERLLTGHVGREQVVASVVSGLTVLAGVAAGRVLREQPGRPGVQRLLCAAAGAGAAGLLLARSVPIDKTLWTPSFVLVTAAICSVLCSVAVILCDWRVPSRVLQPLQVLGANAIAVYVAITLLYGVLLAPVRAHLVLPLQLAAGDQVAAVAYAASSVVTGWALCRWLYHRMIFVKI